MDGALDGALDGHVDRSTRSGSAARGSQAGFAALLPMRALPRFTPGELLKTIKGIVGQTGASVELVPELTHYEQSPGSARVWHRPKVPPRVGVTVAGITLVVEGQDRPALDAGGVEVLNFRSWPTGSREVLRGRAHVRIFETSPVLSADLDLNHDRASALTAVAAAVVELAKPFGMIWVSSGVAVPADELLSAMPALMDGEPPVALWIGVAPEAWGAVATRGLYPLLGAEIELRARGLSTAMAERIVMGLAVEILETGCPPGEGKRIEAGPRGALRVRYRGAEEGGVPAILLDEAAPGLGRFDSRDVAAGVA